MIIFKLPDLGEGLPDAIIREWYIKEGDEVAVDQPLVAMETAKALVDVPAAFAGKVAKLFGNVGDTIDTGNPLIGFEGEGEEEIAHDAGTVVGTIETSDNVIDDAATGVQVSAHTDKKIRVTPKLRALARQLQVDLSTITPSGERISEADIRLAAKQTTHQTQPQSHDTMMQALSPSRKAMVLSMQKSRDETMPVTIFDEVDINDWSKDTDITLRIINAIAIGCQSEPLMNAAFNAETFTYRLNEHINLGIAVDTKHGLFVPVIKDIANRDNGAIREDINRFKQQAQSRSIPAEDLRGATIMLSNYGTLAGRYANPIMVPPLVCIVGIGKIRDAVIAVDGKPAVRKVMPIVVTSDHRFITGGEMVRFLAKMIEALQKT